MFVGGPKFVGGYILALRPKKGIPETIPVYEFMWPLWPLALL